MVSEGRKVPKSLCWGGYERRRLLLLYLPGLGVLFVLARCHSDVVLEGCTEIALACKSDSFMIVICLEGAGALVDSNGYNLNLKQGETVLVPAVTDQITFNPYPQLKILTCWI